MTIQHKSYFLIFIILLPFFAECTENLDMLYSTSFLKNYSAVNDYLKKHGFKDITFKTPDNLTLHGLFLERPNATCNAIICAGWLPGKKEGMATFYDLLPPFCNILLFDARGRGNSDGSLLWKLWQYGINEYKDIIGTIDHVHQINSLPIVIVGICSGAFNAAHALVYLEQHNQLKASRVKGLIFDSGWGSVAEIVRTAPPAGIEKRLYSLLKYIYDKKLINQSLFFTWGSRIARFSYLLSYYACKSVVSYHEATTTLFNKIHRLSLPIFFIHSHDDTYASKGEIVKLSQLTPHSTCWWIKKSFHAQHHLIHKKLYKEKTAVFINNILQ